MRKIGERAFEELQNPEFLCDYCEAYPGHYSMGNMCEGGWCNNAYEAFLDEKEITDRVVKIAMKTEVKIRRN